MRPVCSASSSTDSSSSAVAPSTPPSLTDATSSASRPRIVSSCASACTVCASASATSRASPFDVTSSVIFLLADQGAQLVLEAAGLDRAVDPALLRLVRLPPPAAGTQVLARGRRPRARCASDRGVALVVERVVGKLVLAHVVPYIVLGPLGERVQLHDRAVVVVDLDLPHVAARRPLVAAQPGDPRVEPCEVLRQRLHLAHLAAEQPVLHAPVEEVRAVLLDHRVHRCRRRGEQV